MNNYNSQYNQNYRDPYNRGYNNYQDPYAQPGLSKKARKKQAMYDENGVKKTSGFKKFLRTFFFLTLLVSAFAIASLYLLEVYRSSAGNEAFDLADKFSKVKFLDDSNVRIIGQVAFAVFFSSGLGLSFTARKGFIISLLTFIFLLASALTVYVASPFAEAQMSKNFGKPIIFYNIYTSFTSLFLNRYVDKITSISWFIKFITLLVPGAMIVSSIFVLIYCKTRKPKMSAIALVSIAVIFFMIVFILEAIINVFFLFPNVNFFDKIIKFLAKNASYINMGRYGLRAISYILLTFAGLFGVLTMRKN